MNSDTTPPASRRIAVWDAPTRLFHWALVVLIAFLWWTAETDRMDWHKLAGFAAAGLIVFRIYWGLFGSETSRFRSFMHGPRGVWNYLRARLVPGPGHNPLGGWSVAALLCVLVTETGLGLFAIDEDGLESGPLASTVSFDVAREAAHWHGVLFNGLLALVGLHIAAILVYLLFRQNLIGPMITGWKTVASGTAAPSLAPLRVLLPGIVLAGGVCVGLWWLDTH
ncbi:MAG: cytochrome b/b6 domain-containing protein [Rhizomicrobium sp.]|jgi:cytochrome b